ncbi:MAG: DUF1566 domain-containing protein [Magnetococcus sp. DMHC-6]
MKMLKTVSVLVATLFLGTGVTFAEDMTIPNTFTSGTKIMSSEVNENFDVLVKEINELKKRLRTLEDIPQDPPCIVPNTDGFCDNYNGTITYAATGVVYLANANCFGEMDWDSAMSAAATLASGACGLTDGSTAGEWRLPKYEYPYELSLLFYIKEHPTIRSLFINVQNSSYWSSSLGGNGAWLVNLNGGSASVSDLTFPRYVWPVRDGS